jgi:hypothetical protein
MLRPLQFTPLNFTRPPIGVAVINFQDIQKALEEQKIYQVPVADQTENQILFIGIEVDSVTSGK